MIRLSCVCVLLLFAQISFSQTNLRNAKITVGGQLVITPSTNSSLKDLDWYSGQWQISNKKLKQRLKKSNEWNQFNAKDSVVRIVNGTGYANYYSSSENGQPYAGVSLTLYDAKTRLWSIYWADQNSGVIQAPVVGSFENNVGTFYGLEKFEGKTILVRSEWEIVNRNHAVWRQAFSPDNGKTWETNWIMDEKRVRIDVGVARRKMLTHDPSVRMPEVKFDKDGNLSIAASATSSPHDFDFLHGYWRMYHSRLNKRLQQNNDWTEFESWDENYGMLNGFGNMDVYRTDQMPNMEGMAFEGVTIRLFDPKTKLWSLTWLASNTAAIDPPQIGSFENGIGHFFAKDVFYGKPILVVFRWDVRNPDMPIWSQAFSDDNGKTWEWNWFNVSERIK